jgi:hypothetical protein
MVIYRWATGQTPPELPRTLVDSITLYSRASDVVKSWCGGPE